VIVVRREGSWAGGRRRLRVRLRRLGRLRTPVLVVAAALFGAAASAAVLVGFWDKEAGRRKAVEARLAESARHAQALAGANATLRKRLAASRATSTRLEQGSAQLRAAAEKLLAENRALTETATRLHGKGGSLERGAASVSKLAATLGSDLVAVLSYITNTHAGSLDPAYLKAQLDYLRPAVQSVRSAADGLGADAGSYAKAVDGFAAQVSAYAAALDRLARERAPG
jgi:murein L,D-transpeptidase YcbB/YkuD